MGTPRILNDEQEREVALAYLCGFDAEEIGSDYGVGPDTVRISILGKRSREWQDPLVEFYRSTPPQRKSRNAAHAYLGTNGRDVPRKELLDEFPEAVLDRVSGLYVSGIEGVVDATHLKFFIDPSNGYQELVSAVFGYTNPTLYVRNRFLDNLGEAYQSEDNLGLDRVLSETQRGILSLIKEGGFALTPAKMDLVKIALEKLTDLEVDVISRRFGLEGERSMSFDELADSYEVTPERIRQVEAKALRKLRHPSRSKYLRPLASPATPDAIEAHLEELKMQKERNEWYEALEPEIRRKVLNEVATDSQLFRSLQAQREKGLGDVGMTSVDELELSVRTANVLQNLNVRNFQDIMEISHSDFLRGKNAGRKSLNELRTVLLDDYGLVWPTN
tara:strand:- start:2275 stop:3441 length:1167 start_codon:yes stop_codon:yes gene_type:complete